MTSTRAQAVAEILWELKRADKVASYTHIAGRAGFSAGSNGRTMDTCLKTVRRDWPHLQWWRAIKDDGRFDEGCEQAEKLRECGFDIAQADGDDGAETVSELESHLMNWEPAEESAAEE